MNGNTTLKQNWTFVTDGDFMSPDGGLAKLWETVVSADLSDDDMKQAFKMLQDIASAKTGAGSGVASHRLTGKALRLQDVIQSFREAQTPTAETQELHAFNEAEKSSTKKAKADGLDLTEAEKKAVAWYDNVEKALQGLIKRIQYDQTGAFIGGEDETLFMRRMVGAGGLMAITSPATPVKQNVLMTLLGVLVTENSLKEVYEDYIKTTDNKPKTFVQFVEDIVQPENHKWFRAVLNKIDEKLSVEKGTGFLLSGAEFRRSEETTEEKRKAKTLEQKTKQETVLTEVLKKENPKATDVFTEIQPPTLNIPKGSKAVDVRFKLSENQEITVKTAGIDFNKLRKGVLLYLDALATPELGDIDPVTKEPTVQAKWTFDDFMQFYNNTTEVIEKAKLTMLEDLGKAFIEREKQLRYGEKPLAEAKSTQTAPVGAQSVFGNALRDYYITHFGAEATKVKSFGLSVVFKTLADRLGLGSSLLPSVVYDVWMNANIHNLLREAETGVNNTGLPNKERVYALQQKYRQALLPYGFDVEFSYDERNKTVNVAVKDFETGKVYQRKTENIGVFEMEKHDLATFNAIKTAPENTPLNQIRNEWKQKRMFFASEQTEATKEKALRLTNLTKVYLRRFGEEWHSVYQAGTEPAGATVLKELENALSHFMNIRYDQDGNVFILPTHPFYRKIQQSAKNEELKQLFDGKKEVAIEEIFQHGKEEILTGKNKKALWDLYKAHVDKLREGGVPMAFSEEIMKNAMYVDPTKPMEPRKLQALLWVCTRGAV